MGYRINTNVVSLAAQRSLQGSSAMQAKNLEKMASGSRIVRSADDAAGLAISEKLQSQIRSTNQAERNANDGISLVQTAEGGLNEVSNILTRLRELSIQAASDTVGEKERSFTDLEYQNLKQEIQRISQVTEFNGKKLLDGTGDSYDFQIGINNNDFEDRIAYDANVTNSTLGELGIEDISVGTKEGAQTALQAIDNAVQNVAGHRAQLGAIQNRLTSTISNLQVTNENLSAANSRVRDVDYAAATADATKNGILQQAGTSVLAQANMKSQSALKLIG